MSRQPVFYVLKTNRKNQFLIETRIWNRNGMYVEKKAASPASRDHLGKMLESYKALSGVKMINASIVAPTKISPDVLRFDFIVGKSVERTLLENVLADDRRGVYSLIDTLFTLIDALPSLTTNPTENLDYVNVFGKSFNAAQECTSLGVIDLNLDNLIIDARGGWHLYDYEWVFDFPVPKQLLRARILWFFLTRHRETLRYHSQRIESVQIGDSLFAPKYVYDHYQKDFNHLEELSIAESAFQSYTSGKVDKDAANFDVKPADEKIFGLDAIIKKHVNSATEKLKETLKDERKQNAQNEQKLDAILSSKTYDVATKMAMLKRQLKFWQ